MLITGYLKIKKKRNGLFIIKIKGKFLKHKVNEKITKYFTLEEANSIIRMLCCGL